MCGHIWSCDGDQQIVTVYGALGYAAHEFVIAAAHAEWGDDKGAVYGVVPEAQREANARLIAAAPDLLATLKGSLCFGCGVRFGEPIDARSRGCVTCGPARAVIAKAEGRT